MLERILAVPATRTVRNIPTELQLDEDDGMPAPCALSFDNITTMPKALLTGADHQASDGETGAGLSGSKSSDGLLSDST